MMKLLRFSIPVWFALATLLGPTITHGQQMQPGQMPLVQNYEQADPMSPAALPANVVYEGEGQVYGGPDGACDSCNTGGCQDGKSYGLLGLRPLCGGAPASDPCPLVGGYLFSGYDSWRGPADGQFQNNNGAHWGGNVAGPVWGLAEHGIAWQAGGSYGLYDWSGRSSATNAGNQSVQSQAFVTYGFFRRADCGRRISWGVVQDWMINNNFGVDAQSFTLSQWRGQVAYALSERNEIGFIGTIRDQGAFKPNAVGAGRGTALRWQAINTAQVFFHRKFNRLGADGWFNVGVAEDYRLDPAQGGNLGDLLLSTTFNVPLNDQLSLYANWTYLKPTGDPPRVQNALDEVFNLSFGIAVYPGRGARSTNVAGRKFMPYMPVANNGSFLVDYNNGNGP